MPRNRVKKSSAVNFAPALRALAACLLLACAGLGYLEQKNQLYTLGTEKRELESRLDRLTRDNALRARVLDSLKAPADLEARVRALGLALAPPTPSQIVRLEDRSEN